MLTKYQITWMGSGAGGRDLRQHDPMRSMKLLWKRRSCEIWEKVKLSMPLSETNERLGFTSSGPEFHETGSGRVELSGRGEWWRPRTQSTSGWSTLDFIQRRFVAVCGDLRGSGINGLMANAQQRECWVLAADASGDKCYTWMVLEWCVISHPASNWSPGDSDIIVCGYVYRWQRK